ncbi:MAG TPA: signal recognition particle-docking protein FtsY [Actinomycetota bacterium]
MPGGIGLEIVVALAALALLVAAALVGRRMRRRPAPVRAPKPAARESLGARVRSIFRGAPSEESWGELEDALIRADVGPGPAAELVTRVREAYEPGDDPAALLKREVAAVFESDPPLVVPPGFAVLMVVGVNGTGKTTTIGKLAKRLAGGGRSVALAASDTFRAAAAEQLEEWGTRAGVEVISQQRGADPGAVAFDAVQAARARDMDVVIVDTAGRLHNRQPLMDELRKVKRVLEKAGGSVDEVLLVLDATTGQNGIAQATAFTEAVDVTGVALTKFDGTAKGGVLLAVRERLGVPVKLVGMGEGIDDLEPFDAGVFADRILER